VGWILTIKGRSYRLKGRAGAKEKAEEKKEEEVFRASEREGEHRIRSSGST